MQPQMNQMPPPPDPHKSGGLFKHKSPPPPGPNFTEIRSDINMLERRFRLLEESIKNLRKSLQVTESNMITKNRTFSTEIKALTSDLDETKSEITEIKEKIISIINELQSYAKLNDVKILEKYLHMWNPVKFVTQDEVEKIIEEKLKKNRKL